MKIDMDALRESKEWPDEVGFIPFVGRNYQAGIGGKRVFLLGESHYVKDVEVLRDPFALRLVTVNEFEDCEVATERSWGRFYRRLDSILAGCVQPSGQEAADAWSHVAYANFVQHSVGTSASCRPDDDMWRTGEDAFRAYVDRLMPDVILVIGRMTYDHTPSKGARRLEGGLIKAPNADREIWEVDHPGGSALMSWVYHPSRPNDSVETSIMVFQQLLQWR